MCIPKPEQIDSMVIFGHAFPRSTPRSPGLNLGAFWKWDSFDCYKAALLYSFVAYLVFYTSMHSPFVVELTGSLSQVFDAIVTLPQAIKVCRKRCVKNLR